MRNAWLPVLALVACQPSKSRAHAVPPGATALPAPVFDASSSVEPSAAAPSAAAPSAAPPSAAPPSAPPPALTDAALVNLRKKWPNATVQSAVEAHTPAGAETLALVWEAPPTPEARCPPEKDLASAYDIQSCTGFVRALAGAADVVRFRGDALVDDLPLTPLFASDDNPSGVERDGKRGPRESFIPSDYALELYDLDGDGYAAEFLVHLGNAPYAIIGYWAAFGIVHGHLGPVALDKGAPLVAAHDAWLELAAKGRGVSELACGARCGNGGTRWTVERGKNHRIFSREFWSCTPDDEKSWKPGPQPRGRCES